MLNACGSPLRTLPVIGVACLVMGALLALAEIYRRHDRTVDNMRVWDGFMVGVAQVGALVPGVSRSGSTLTASLFLGLEREQAARFSFLIGIPAIALAGARELFVLVHAHIPAEAWSVLAVGLIVGALSSFAALWSLMRFLERFSTWPFVIYRIGLGVVLLAVGFLAWT